MMLTLVREKIDFMNYLFLKINSPEESFSNEGVKILVEARKKKLLECDPNNCSLALQFLKNTKIIDTISDRGVNSLAFFQVRRAGKRFIKDLTQEDFEHLSFFMDRSLVPYLKKARSHIQNINIEMRTVSIITERETIDLKKLTSRQIREKIAPPCPILVYKIGAVMTPAENASWCYSLKKVVSVRHRNVLLRAAHGDIYSKSRLYRFGLAEDPQCPRCPEIDDVQHKLLNCTYVRRIWEEVYRVSNRLKPVNQNLEANFSENKMLGASINTTPLVLTLHAEILLRINALKENALFMIRPKNFVKNAVDNLIMCERSSTNRNLLIDAKNETFN